jgi:type IV pilus assembly protein PilE
MNRTKTAGFTLIELMIVVAIIGILATVALGFYGENVIASNRTEGRSALQQAAGTLEKCKSLYGTYAIGGGSNCGYADFQTTSGYYNIAATVNGTDTSFVLTATPVAGSAQAGDTDCTAITLTNTGVKNGTGADPTQCW